MVTVVFGGRVLMVPLAPARSGDPARCRPIGCYEASQAFAAGAAGAGPTGGGLS